MRRIQLRQSAVVVDISLIFHVLMMSDVQKGLLPAVSSISVLYPKNTQSCTPEIFFPILLAFSPMSNKQLSAHLPLS